MSCLWQVSKRLKGHAADDDANDTPFDQQSPSLRSSPEVADKVWTLGDLTILHELHKPIAVIAPGLYNTPYRFVCFLSVSKLLTIYRLLLCGSSKVYIRSR